MENKKEERYRLSVVLKAVLYDEVEDKFLLLEMSDKDSYFVSNYGNWSFPGGKLEDEESMRQGLGREIQEELGEDVKFEIIAPLNTVKSSYSTGQAIYIDYLVKYLGGEIKISEEHSKYVWETAEGIEKSEEYKSWMKKTVAKAKKYLAGDEFLEGWRRCQADFENYKRRQSETQKELASYSAVNLILEMLPVIDNFYMSTEHIPESGKKDPWVIGIMHIQRQLEQILTNNGVEEIEVKEGDKFDPAVCEAIENKDCQKEDCKNVVKKVVLKGYKMGERVIRAARVIVE